MTRKAAAKRSEANAAVRRRAAGLDQRFKMSASVAGFPSINAATACLSFFVRSRRHLVLLRCCSCCKPFLDALHVDRGTDCALIWAENYTASLSASDVTGAVYTEFDRFNASAASVV